MADRVGFEPPPNRRLGHKKSWVLLAYLERRQSRKFIKVKDGGQSGIRTHETRKRLHAFQACAFDHSATCPHQLYVLFRCRGVAKRKRTLSFQGRGSVNRPLWRLRPLGHLSFAKTSQKPNLATGDLPILPGLRKGPERAKCRIPSRKTPREMAFWAPFAFRRWRRYSALRGQNHPARAGLFKD